MEIVWRLLGGGGRGAGRVCLPASGGAASGTARGAGCRGRRTAAAAAVVVVVVVSASAARAAEGPAGPLAAELDVRDAGLRRVGGEVLEAAAAAAAAARGEPLAVREAGKPCRELLFSSPPSFAFPLFPPPPPHQNRERRRVRCLAAPVLLGLLLQGFFRGVVGFCCFVFAFFPPFPSPPPSPFLSFGSLHARIRLDPSFYFRLCLSEGGRESWDECSLTHRRGEGGHRRQLQRFVAAGCG
ncbi:uncharacterized protein LOC127476520 [Manacus candei]|uniref:uncharacterized protein LOC127476520 n=1 Tax=Manacus candei TaxID=415023 RepID=UPI002225EE34|nr:uncharacterized protein LOC127476520 [Manacus candei]